MENNVCIAAIFCFRNEEKYLESFIKHLEPYIDFFVALDDGSTDNSKNIVCKSHKLRYLIENDPREGIEYNEKNNRKILVETAYKNDATWVLCCDPDERFETRFLKNIRNIINEALNKDKYLIGLSFKELWDDYRIYRYDGIWNEKKKYILFRLNDRMTFSYKYNYHAPWFYDEIVGKEELTSYSLYHLKMIDSQDREGRKNLYNLLDPNKTQQSIGYDYLNDLNGIKLKAINITKSYDYSLIPSEIKNKSIKSEIKYLLIKCNMFDLSKSLYDKLFSNRIKNVLFVSENFVGGGLETRIIEQVNFYNRKGINCYLICQNFNQKYSKYFKLVIQIFLSI